MISSQLGTDARFRLRSSARLACRVDQGLNLKLMGLIGPVGQVRWRVRGSGLVGAWQLGARRYRWRSSLSVLRIPANQ